MLRNTDHNINSNKIFQSGNGNKATINNGKSGESAIRMIVLAVVAGLIVAGLSFWFGWNGPK